MSNGMSKNENITFCDFGHLCFNAVVIQRWAILLCHDRFSSSAITWMFRFIVIFVAILFRQDVMSYAFLLIFQYFHCCHNFPWLGFWGSCTIIFSQLFYIYPGKAGFLSPLLLCSPWCMQITVYVLTYRSYILMLFYFRHHAVCRLSWRV